MEFKKGDKVWVRDHELQNWIKAKYVRNSCVVELPHRVKLKNSTVILRYKYCRPRKKKQKGVWRLLEGGEKIRKGDEFFDVNRKWSQTDNEGYGCIVLPSYGPIRRKL